MFTVNIGINSCFDILLVFLAVFTGAEFMLEFIIM